MECIRSLATREGISLNQASLKLLRKGAGLVDNNKRGKVGNSLDHLIGLWSREEADEFDAIIEEEFERIDKEIWE